jgi:chromosome segregation ATPase
LRSLIERAQKGKIKERQYKVQRRALELRRESLSKQIADLKAIFRSVGGNYANLVKQLDAAETELNKIEVNLRNAEARRRTGELQESVVEKGRQEQKDVGAGVEISSP